MDATAPATPHASDQGTSAQASSAEDTCSPYDVFARDCPSRGTLEHVTGRWGSLTLSAISDSTVRFNELRRRVDGVSEKMLSQTLHALERDGLVNRRSQETNPPRVDYCLTPLGHDVARRLRELFDLVEGRMPEVLAAREAYDARGGR
ncbi:helix-turn-helix transcriptional regulator [Streptomyces sp. PTM05]|uniref:Helix-turn-helix transcriptional regulator n=1 Tax=Streptantibioticus parmotrematis TaxID=2873249 RepID=A0ABS7R017_9ACTN|nr:helix-turn-helix domain-containing protein [Streptantibioticus parmotrematis]MBY8888802.1 helix-turn-helix transcriptional regulator [Streptantibioticus parmotrematis]